MRRFTCTGTVAAALILTSGSSFAEEPSDESVSSIRVNGDVERQVGAGCRYSASVHGTVLPVGGQKEKREPIVEPNLDVEASVVCPRSEAIKITDSVMGTGPLTYRQLERAIERRASVAVESQGRRCVYVPTFALTKTDLKLASISHVCPTAP